MGQNNYYESVFSEQNNQPVCDDSRSMEQDNRAVCGTRQVMGQSQPSPDCGNILWSQIRQWYYRGSLKSCNYKCSYCPFSKKNSSTEKIKKDETQLFQFVKQMNQNKNIGGAVQIVPYGEALIHHYYWEALAALSKNRRLAAVGAQTNFSFPVEEMIDLYIRQGGILDKLRLWGTFHPEMISAEDFEKQCKRLSRRGVKYCVGAVGVPENLSEIKRLRKYLDPDIYLWINKMDGLGRNYTKEEIQEWISIDEYFKMELTYHKSDPALCRESLFVEADGSLKGCNIAGKCIGNFYAGISGNTKISCLKKECSCYMAYNNRKDDDLFFFYPYPAFRIPEYPKAVFFDVDGTLVAKGQREISKELTEKIKALSRHSEIYLATSLPVEEAYKKTKGILSCIRGGVFANGGHCIILPTEEKSGYESLMPVETEWIVNAKNIQKKYGYKLHIYERQGKIYKVTLSFAGNRLKKEGDGTELAGQIMHDINVPDTCQWILENNCIQITHAGCGKLEGILKLIGELGFGKDDILTVGDSENDIPMLEFFPRSMTVKDGRICDM